MKNELKSDYHLGEEIFKEYILKNFLGEGGFGKVYLVESGIGLPFALKVLHKDVHMEKRGVESVMWIRSNRLVSIIDYGETVYGEDCVLMEYVRDNLENVLEECPIDEETAHRYFVEILKGLKMLEENGIVHRDIKPANLFILEDIIKIGDFGAAKYTSGESTSMSRVAGTFHYMAPERFKRGFGFSVDRWSAVVIFYRMLTGKNAFDGEDQAQIFEAIMMQEPNLELIPDRYRCFFKKCFEKKVGERYDSAEEMFAETEGISVKLALSDINGMPRVNSKDATAHNKLGNALKDKGEFDAAIDEYKKAIELNPNYAIAYDNLGLALKDKGDLDAAIVEHKKAIELNPEDAITHNNLGNAFYDKGDLDTAIVEHKKAIELNPEDAITHNNLGNAFYDKGDLDAAIVEYKKAIELNPEAGAHNDLGNVFCNKGEPDAAIDEYKKAIELNPEFALAHCNLGNVFCNKGEPDAAIDEYKKAIELNPEFALAHCNLGLVLRAKGEPDAAIDEYKKAIELNPEFALAHCNLGLALRAKGEFDAAVDEFRKAIELNPKDAIAHNNLGLAFHNKGELDAAINEYKKAIELNPEYVNAHNNLGFAFYEKGELYAAIDEYKSD
ncbi:MAG: tetratricopeptide repeat protein [Desulfobacterales bacterium]|nr:tetratricopeptide repeat protein [Desulfobacterales bacterium]